MKRKRSKRNAQPCPAPTKDGPGRTPSKRRSLVLLAMGLGTAITSGLLWFGLGRSAGRDDAEKLDPTQEYPVSTAPGPGPEINSLPRPDAPASNESKGKEASLVEQINRANQLLAKGKAEEAVQVLSEIQRLSPEDEDVRYNLGIALSRVGRNDQAVEQYQEALRLFPDYAEAHNNLGNLLLRMGRRDEALKHFEEAVKITPDYAAAWNNFGTALQQLGRTNEAGEYFHKAVGLDTNYWQARFNLGTTYLQQARLTEARQEFEAVLRLQPDFPPAKAALARLEKGQ